MLKSIFETKVTEFKSTDVEGKGTLRWYNNELYQWVYNCGAIDARADSPACYDASNGGEDYFFQKALPDPADADVQFFAGIWMSAVPTTYYGWIKVMGLAIDAKVAVASGGASAVGDQFVPTTNTTTTGTGAARAFALLPAIDVSDTITTATGYTPFTMQNVLAPHCIALEAAITGGSPATDTAPLEYNMYVKGMLAR